MPVTGLAVCPPYVLRFLAPLQRHPPMLAAVACGSTIVVSYSRSSPILPDNRPRPPPSPLARPWVPLS